MGCIDSKMSNPLTFINGVYNYDFKKDYKELQP